MLCITLRADLAHGGQPSTPALTLRMKNECLSKGKSNSRAPRPSPHAWILQHSPPPPVRELKAISAWKRPSPVTPPRPGQAVPPARDTAAARGRLSLRPGCPSGPGHRHHRRRRAARRTPEPAPAQGHVEHGGSARRPGPARPRPAAAVGESVTHRAVPEG